MANVQLAVEFVLRQEDSRLIGNVTTLPGDSGGPTRFGLASTSHPELVAQGYYDVTKVDRAAALAIAISVYTKIYAAPMLIAGIDDQALATAVFSFGINAYIEKPILFLQEACNHLGHQLTEDGHDGPATLAVVNSFAPDTILGAFCTVVREYYIKLAASNPADAGDLRGWENRVQAWLSSTAYLRAQAAAPASEQS